MAGSVCIGGGGTGSPTHADLTGAWPARGQHIHVGVGAGLSTRRGGDGKVGGVIFSSSFTEIEWIHIIVYV